MSDTNPGPGTFTVCAWCHADNRLTDSSAPIYCANCHHRADAPRENCTCPDCIAPRQLDMLQGLGVRHRDA
jgi:Zn finger protein HypA/HybF involved in hydrogenase expression